MPSARSRSITNEEPSSGRVQQRSGHRLFARPVCYRGFSMAQQHQIFRDILAKDPEAITREWLAEVAASGASGARQASAAELNELLSGLTSGVSAGGDPTRLDQPAWEQLRTVLESLSS